MKKLLTTLFFCATVAVVLAADPKLDPLPGPLTNNAVAGLYSHGQAQIFSFMGMGEKKSWDAITTASYILDSTTGKWSNINPVPGPTGRIAAMAAGAREHVFLLGGYVVDSHGAGMAVPDVGAYQPVGGHWFRGADIPVPVGDAVTGVFNDRYIFLIGGRSNSGIVADVQVYDSEKNKWLKSSTFPGTPVFGHAGAVVDDTIIYIDGARKNPSGDTPRYIPSDECWMGKIDRHDPAKIQWSKLPPHPGDARYRIAAGGSERDDMVYFAGGSATPYDFNGIGYDGKPAELSPMTFALNIHSGKWAIINGDTPNAVMDEHHLIVSADGLIAIGGMDKDHKVTAAVSILPKQAKGK